MTASGHRSPLPAIPNYARANRGADESLAWLNDKN